MKICIVSTIFPPEIGGPSKHIYELAKRLALQQHEIHIVTYTHQDSRHELLDGFNVHRVSIRNLPSSLLPARVYKLRKKIIEIVSRYNLELIYALNIDLAGLPAKMAARKLNKPVVLRYGGDYVWEIMFKFNKTSKTLHDFYESSEGSLFNSLKSYQARMLKKFNHIIVPSDYYKSIIVKHFNISEDTITVIKNPVSFPIKPAPRKKRNELFTLVTASRILRLKGIDYLLEAIKIITRTNNNIKLLIIGDGPYKKNLITRTKELGLEQQVTFIPGMQHEETLKYIVNADAYILSSVSEVAPNVVLEAMSLKTPVVTTLVSDFSASMNNEIALVVPPRDSYQLSVAISSLMNNKKLSTKLSKNAYEYVKKNITWDEALQQTLAIFDKSIKKPLTGQPALSS